MLDLVVLYPEMFPVRRRGLMEGYRSFPVYQYLFYYSVTTQEIPVTPILPGRMEQA